MSASNSDTVYSIVLDSSRKLGALSVLIEALEHYPFGDATEKLGGLCPIVREISERLTACVRQLDNESATSLYAVKGV